MQIGWILGLDIDIPIWAILLVANFVAYYIYMTWNYDYFKKAGIDGPKPVLVLGNLWQWMRKGVLESEIEDSRKYGGKYGIFLGRTPSLSITDPELIKKVYVKEFPYFINRSDFNMNKKGSILSKAVSNLRGEHWKHVRNALSPTFSAAKLKLFQRQMNQCGDQLVHQVRRFHDKDEAFECKDVMSCYAMDIIAYTTYGIELDSHKDPDNIFIRNNKTILKVTLQDPRLILIFFLPFLAKVLVRVFPFFSEKLERFYIKVTNDVLKRRLEANVDLKDFVQLMADARTDEPKEGDELSDPEVSRNDSGELWTQKGLTEHEIAGNSLVFLFAGYETVSASTSFALYCLTVNPECQEKLIEEIDTKIGKKEPTYNDVGEMEYLQQVIDETLRLYPPVPRLERVVNEDVTLDGIFFKKGTQVGIPAIALHMDPNIWPEPEKFNPERFTAEAKETRNQYCYLPFGLGPRNCIGMRLALLEMKIAMTKLFQNFRLVPCEKTQIPLKIQKMRINSEKGIWVKAHPRNEL